jgi:hypothetical protein
MRLVLPISVAIVFAGAIAVACAESDGAHVQDPTRETNRNAEPKMKIRITIAGEAITATLANNEAAKDFASLLPLTLTLNDYADNEKISDLPKKLSTKGAPAAYLPSTGDVTYYAPWGTSRCFTKMGTTRLVW